MCFPACFSVRIATGCLMAALSVVSLSILGADPAHAYDLRENSILHARQGQLLMEQEQYDEASEELKAAIRLNPYTSMSGALYNNLGLAYRALGDYSLAIASFQHACRLQPTYALYYKNLIETYAAAGQLPKAQALLQAITKSNPANAEAWFMLGLLHRENGNRTASKLCFQQLLRLEPESELAKAARAAL